MTVKEIKKGIMNQIQEVEDELILEEVFRLLQLPKNYKDIFDLSEDQMNILNTRTNNVQNGHFVSDEQSEKDLDTWLI